MGSIGEGTLRVTHFFQFLVIVCFCKLTQFLRYSLKFLSGVLCACVIDGEGRLCITGKEILNTKSTKTSSIDIKPTVEVYQHRAVRLTLKVFQKTSLFLKKASKLLQFSRHKAYIWTN